MWARLYLCLEKNTTSSFCHHHCNHKDRADENRFAMPLGWVPSKALLVSSASIWLKLSDMYCTSTSIWWTKSHRKLQHIWSPSGTQRQTDVRPGVSHQVLHLNFKNAKDDEGDDDDEQSKVQNTGDEANNFPYQYKLGVNRFVPFPVVLLCGSYQHRIREAVTRTHLAPRLHRSVYPNLKQGILWPVRPNIAFTKLYAFSFFA